MRVVDRFVEHGPALSFRGLCERVLEPDTDCLILDLDKTTHLGRNLGELLAWELCAHDAYGESVAEGPLRRRFGGRILLDWSQPTRMLRYLLSGARRWALPGTHYLVWGKMAASIPWLRRLAYSRFGPEPTTVVQRRPQMVALTHLATADEPLLHRLARRVWARYAHDQVISREDLDWVRKQNPGIEIILSSASPKAMLDVAVEELGADRATYSTIDRINSGRAKITRLREISPDLFNAGAKVVAISDTSYREDHCWAEHFSCVVDVNSPTPFVPVVTQDSPNREMHSAVLLTRHEQRRRAIGDEGYLDARRKTDASTQRVELDRDALLTRLGHLLGEINQLAERVELLPRQSELACAMARLTESSRSQLSAHYA